jgi:hypothetical protein
MFSLLPSLLIAAFLGASSTSLHEMANAAQLKGRDAFVWQYRGCPQLMVHFKSWNELQTRPPLIVHTSMTDRGLQVADVQWKALQSTDRLSRDVYFLVSCEDLALASLLHVMSKPIDGFEPKFSAVEKAEHLKLKRLFPKFSEATFVWSEGPFLDAQSVQPWIWAPLGISQRGVWVVGLESESPNLDQEVGQILDSLADQNPVKKWSWSEPHFEHEKQFEVFGFMLPWIQKLKSIVNYREFFFDRDWQEDLVGHWKFAGRTDGSVLIQYEFLGGREVSELEAQLVRALRERGLDERLKFRQIYFRPFLRSPLFGHEVEGILEALEGVPQVKVAPVISSVESPSHLFRQQGFQALELSALYSLHSPAERRAHEGFKDARAKAVAVHTEIFRQIMRR